MGGAVVHALHGQRQLYRPLQTPLCPTSEPAEVVAAFLKLFPFDTLYIADLDAIMEKGDQSGVVRFLLRRFTRLDFWIDAGLHSMEYSHARVRPIIGSETGISPAELAQMVATDADVLLSLDFRNEGFAGDPALLDNCSSWPRDIIAMSMARVGTRSGPPLDLVNRLRVLAPQCRIHAAGGVRGAADLQALEEAGASGALLATALHDGTVGSLMIQTVTGGKKTPA